MTHILLIFLSFALIHSITVASWFKDLCRRSFGETFMRVWYRFLYNTVSVLTAGIAIYLIAHVPDRTIWVAPMWLTWVMRSIQSAGFVLGIRAFEYMDTKEFMGFRQVWHYLRTGEIGGDIEGLTRKELVSTGVYGMVRHPMYVAGLLIFTFSPRVTVNGLTITVLADLYFIFGMFIEERRFVKIYGEQYREYMRTVPMMVPRVFSWQGRDRKEG